MKYLIQEVINKLQNTVFHSGPGKIDEIKTIEEIKAMFESSSLVKKNKETGRYEHDFQNDSDFQRKIYHYKRNLFKKRFFKRELETKKEESDSDTDYMIKIYREENRLCEHYCQNDSNFQREIDAYREKLYQKHFKMHQGLVVNMKSSNRDWTLLAICAKLDLIKIAEWLIRVQGANVNLKTGAGMSPIHFAALYGQRDMIKLLLENGANKENLTRHKSQLDTETGSMLIGRSSLGCAVQGLHIENVKYLLSRGAWPHIIRIFTGKDFCPGPLTIAHDIYDLLSAETRSSANQSDAKDTKDTKEKSEIGKTTTSRSPELANLIGTKTPSLEDVKQCAEILEFAFEAIQESGSLSAYYLKNVTKALNEIDARFWPKEIAHIVAGYYAPKGFLIAYTNPEQRAVKDGNIPTITSPLHPTDTTVVSAAAASSTKLSAGL